MTASWWAAFPSAETKVTCGDTEHRLRWADGRLQPLDHADAEGELVLAALGGETTECLDLCGTWDRHADDLAVLALAPRSPEDRLSITANVLEEFSTPTLAAGWAPVPSVPAMAGEADLRAGLFRLLALGEAFQLRLAGTVAHAWSTEGAHGANSGRAIPALTAALTGRLAPAAAQWLAADPGQVECVRHDGPGWGAIELDGARTSQRLRGRLPVAWLAAVWAPGLAVIDGHLVVAVHQATWPTAQVLALRRPGTDPVELTVGHDGEGWKRTA